MSDEAKRVSEFEVKAFNALLAHPVRGAVAFSLNTSTMLTVLTPKGYRKKPFNSGTILKPISCYRSEATNKLIFRFEIRYTGLGPDGLKDVKHVEMTEMEARDHLAPDFVTWINRMRKEGFDLVLEDAKTERSAEEVKKTDRYKDNKEFGSW